MTFGGSGSVHDYHRRGHHVFGMHSHVTYMCAWRFPCGQRGPFGSVAIFTAYMAQIPGVLDRMIRQMTFLNVSAVGFISFLPDSQDFAADHVVWTSHGKATDAHTISHVVEMREPVPLTN